MPPGRTLPSAGTIRSNQSEKNGFSAPRGWVILEDREPAARPQHPAQLAQRERPLQNALEVDPGDSLDPHLNAGREIVEGGRDPLGQPRGAGRVGIEQLGVGAELLRLPPGHPGPDAGLEGLGRAADHVLPPGGDDNRPPVEVRPQSQLEVGD